jgi:hypothetical protein
MDTRLGGLMANYIARVVFLPESLPMETRSGGSTEFAIAPTFGLFNH